MREFVSGVGSEFTFFTKLVQGYFMKAVFEAKKLAEVLSAVYSAVPSRTTKPALAQVKLDVRNNAATITATDTEVTVRRNVEVDQKEEGSALIDPKRSLVWLKEQKGQVTVAHVGESVVLSCGKSKISLPLMDVNEFPDAPDIEGETPQVIMPFPQLADVLAQTAFAAEKKEAARWAITGIFFEGEGDKMNVVATDTHCLALRRVSGKYGAFTALIPNKTADLLSKNAGVGEIAMYFKPNAAVFKTDELFIHTRLVEGKFPPYRSIIPKKLVHTLEVKASELATALRESAAATDEMSKRVELNFNKDVCLVSAIGPGCSGESQFEVPGSEAEVLMPFDPDYILNGLKVIDKNAIVKLKLTDSTKPMLIEYGDDLTYLVMPMGERGN